MNELWQQAPGDVQLLTMTLDTAIDSTLKDHGWQLPQTLGALAVCVSGQPCESFSAGRQRWQVAARDGRGLSTDGPFAHAQGQDRVPRLSWWWDVRDGASQRAGAYCKTRKDNPSSVRSALPTEPVSQRAP